MIRIRNLNITRNNNNSTFIKDFNLDVSVGDKVAIIGEEGNGKTTLLKALIGDKSIESYCTIQGEIYNNESFGYLPQFIDESWANKTVGDFLLQDNPYDMPDYNLMANYATQYQLFNSLNLSPDIIYNEQLVGTLSGGEKIKIGLLKALSKHPTALILDEPTNDLDINAIVFLEEFLNKQTLPIIFVSHDELLIENVANTIVHIEQLRNKTNTRITVYKGKYSQYLEERTRTFERQNQMATFESAQLEEAKRRIREMKAQAASNTAYNTKRIRQIKSIERKLEKREQNMTRTAETEEAISLILKDNKSLPERKMVVELNGPLCLSNGQVVQDEINLQVMGNQRLAIIGENGSGKTTLLKEINRILSERPDLKVGYMPQNYEEMLDVKTSPVEFLMELNPSFKESEVTTCLGCLRFTYDEMKSAISKLSGGQKAKLLIAGFILNGCNVLLLDEPTRNLSPLSSPVLVDLVNQFQGCVISVSHDRKWIDSVCDSTLELKKKINFNDMGCAHNEKK